MSIELYKEELELLEEIYKSKQVLRKFLDSREIRVANNLVKLKLIDKGISDDKQSSVCYNISRTGSKYLNELWKEL